MSEGSIKTLLILTGTAVAALVLLLYRPAFLADTSMMAILIGLEVVVLALAKFRHVFFPVVILTFLWAGSALPFHEVLLSARWYVLGIGAAAGMAVYLKTQRHVFSGFHLVALSCAASAFASAYVSSYRNEAALKALSLFLLFAYSSSGMRAAVSALTPEVFFRRMVICCEVLTIVTAVAYLIFRWPVFGNPNSLGAIMSVMVLPALLWGFLTSESQQVRLRLGIELTVAFLLLVSTYARASMAAAAFSSLLLFIALRRYRLLVKASALAIVIVVCVALFLPSTTGSSDTDQSESIASRFVYKGHEDRGIFGSRKSVWQQTWSVIQENPWFGSGFGTSFVSGDMTKVDYRERHIDSWVIREHGNSYLAIAEWTGLLGVVPFYILAVLSAINVGRVFSSVHRTDNVFSAAVPAATIVAAGLVHAMFEDWMFACGYYVCVFFWAIAFTLVDLRPRSVVAYIPESSAVFGGRPITVAASAQ